MIKAAKMIQSEGICSLSSVFRAAFPGSKYNSAYAKQRLLSMPVVAIRVGSPSSGVSDVRVMELIAGVDYIQVEKMLSAHSLHQTSASNAPPITKAELQRLLSFAQSQREREQLTYAVFKATGLSATAARKHLGIHNITQRASQVEDALEEAERMHKCIESLSLTQEKAVLQSLGIPVSSESDSDTSSSDFEDTSESAEMPSVMPFPSEKQILRVLRESDWNWIECVDQIEQQVCEVEGDNEEDTQFNALVEKMYLKLICSPELQASEKELLQQSHDACEAANAIQKARYEREANAFNGYVVEDSDREDPEDVAQVKSLSDEKLKTIVLNRRKAIQRHTRYLKNKYIAERNFLARKTSPRVSSILSECPDIGSVIEEFVESRNIGADAWRRTGVLTFDGNTQVQKKVTFERIRQHLESTYKRKFSYGTVVQLCIARNKRRKP